MSSRIRTISRVEAAFLLVSMLAMTVWYAWPQIVYSLFIVYDIARTLFPDIVPDAVRILPYL